MAENVLVMCSAAQIGERA